MTILTKANLIMCSNSNIIPMNPCIGQSVTNEKSPPRRWKSLRSSVRVVCNMGGLRAVSWAFHPRAVKSQACDPKAPVKDPLGFKTVTRELE